MIQLANVTKRADARVNGSSFLLKDASINLPVDCFVELTCPLDLRREMFFDLISGVTSPDRGFVIRRGVRFSPLLNRGGGPSLLQNNMSLRENIRFQAAISFIPPRLISDFVVEVCDCADNLDDPIAVLPHPKRRAAEAAMFTVIPYDCYLVDQFNSLPDIIQMQLAYAAKSRGAGVYFGATKTGSRIDFRDANLYFKGGSLELVYAGADEDAEA